MGRFDNIDLGASATMRRQILATVRRRHDDLQDAIKRLEKSGFGAAALELQKMIDEEKLEVGLE